MQVSACSPTSRSTLGERVHVRDRHRARDEPPAVRAIRFVMLPSGARLTILLTGPAVGDLKTVMASRVMVGLLDGAEGGAGRSPPSVRQWTAWRASASEPALLPTALPGPCRRRRRYPKAAQLGPRPS